MQHRRTMLCVCIAILPLLMAGCGSNAPTTTPESTSSAAQGQLRAATALSNHYVEVQFSAPMDATAAQAERYVITGPGQTPLPVEAARLNDDRTSVTLTTGAQEAVEYTLTMQPAAPLRDAALSPDSGGVHTTARRVVTAAVHAAAALTTVTPAEAVPAAANTVTFTGSVDTGEPTLETAIALSNTAVLLTFSERMDKTTAENRAFYSIAPANITILSAVLGADELTVLLTTSSQSGTEYTVKATNVKSKTAGKLINPFLNTATFLGIPPADTTPPRLLSAMATGSTSVLLSFSEPVADNAADPRHFTICLASALSCTPELTVISAQPNVYNTQVLLTTLPLVARVTYKVVVTNVRDRATLPAANVIDPAANTATFTFVGTPEVTSTTLPRVLGAASTSNTTVIVQFSQPMADSVLNPAHYIVVQENVNPEVGFVGVTSVRFPALPDRKTVELTTSSQNEVTYRLRVVNVTDQAGNPLAPQFVDRGVLIDPTSVLFPGTPPTAATSVDTDGDGLADAIERRGWVVRITLTDGTVLERQVTSDPTMKDTDGDGLDDLEEYRLASDPRRADTDGDRLSDNEEFNVIFSNLNKQDSDDDGIDDQLEVEFFKTNALVADTDGDGFSDDKELFELHRNPRVADLPLWQISVGEVRLSIDERYTFVDERGETVSTTSSTSTTLTQSSETTYSRSHSVSYSNLIEVGVKAGGKFSATTGTDAGTSVEKSFEVSGKGVVRAEWSMQIEETSKEAATNAFELSLAKAETLSQSRTVTREVFGARIEADVTIDNLSDVALTLANVEITVLASAPQDRSRFVPVATLLPSSALTTGTPVTFTLNPLETGRGPIIFSNREVFPNLIEDLMRDPRGLIFRVANFDLKDEAGRNFAFIFQEVQDRTAGLIIDFGDGTVERSLVAIHPVLGAPRDQGGAIIGGFDGTGKVQGLPIDYVLQNILGLSKNRQEPDGIVAGPNGAVESIAAGDDVQLIVPGVDGVLEDTVVITAGENGVLDSVPGGDDQLAVISGYATTATCGANTPSVVLDGGNGRAETLAAQDDVQAVPFGAAVAAGTPIITAGSNGFVDSVAAGDDLFLGPGSPCTVDADCPGGTCSGREALLRFKHRRRGAFGRFWTVLTPDLDQLGVDFGKIIMRPGQSLGLAFVQDLDRDGVIAQQEYLYGSSDTKQDTDDDGLDDFSEIRVGWEVGVLGQPIRKVFPDPRTADTDRDGLTDFEEQDLRRVKCECAGGPREGQMCTQDSECGSGTCIDRLPVGEICLSGTCPACPAVAIRTNPRQRDSDDDRVRDAEEVFGFLSGAGIIEPLNVIIVGANRRADTRACPLDVCMGGPRAGQSCRRDRDCPHSTCNVTGCDDVQVVPVGQRGLNPRSVVVGPGDDGILQTPAASGDTLVLQGDGLANTRAVGDDKQVVGVGIFVAPGDVIIKPGLNGVLDSVPAGDDVRFLGESFKITNALAPDTDFDQVPDGIERLLGSDPTDPTDAGTLADLDEDGLTDAEEAQLGWTVTVYDRDGVATIRTVFSNPNVPDSDLDGLPDFMERALGLDPTSADTDGDGLEDFDELGAEIFAQFKQFNDFFPGFFVDVLDSRLLGTDPTRVDTDGDGLSDKEEIDIGFRVVIPGEGRVRLVFTNPTLADTDSDGLSDAAERASKTDPTDPDSDDDTRLDGAEVNSVTRTDPLRPDTGLLVRFAVLNFQGGPHDGDNEVPEWYWTLHVQRNSSDPTRDEEYPGVQVSGSDAATCQQHGGVPHPLGCVQTCIFSSGANLNLNARRSIDLRKDEGIVISGSIVEVDGCLGTPGGGFTTSCVMDFTESFSFDTLRSNGFQTKLIQLTGDEGCKVQVLIQLITN